MTIWADLSQTDYRHTFVPVGGLTTRALQAGVADRGTGHGVVLMLHGTSGHLETFVRNVGVFATAGYEVHAIDMMGHGYTDGPGRPYRIAAYVEHALGYLDAVGADRAHIVGEGLGGWVACRLAADHPDRVATLVLAGPGGTVADPEVMDRIRTNTSRAVLSDDVALTRKRLELLMNDPDQVTDELVAVRHRIYHRPVFQQNLPNMLALQEIDNRCEDLLTPEQLGRITAAALLVWGSRNAFGSVAEGERIRRLIPGSELTVFHECGHWPQYELADRFNKEALAFIGNQPQLRRVDEHLTKDRER